MCVEYSLHRFMFIQGGEDCDGSGTIFFGVKALATTIEGLMGVIVEDGRATWQGDLLKWMKVFDLDWDAAEKYQGRY